MKSRCQIPDDYTQYLLGSTNTHLQALNPREVKEVLLLQEIRQLELITLGFAAQTTTLRTTAFDLFSHWMINPPQWAPAMSSSPPRGLLHHPELLQP
jgi:hypothetical protein